MVWGATQRYYCLVLSDEHLRLHRHMERKHLVFVYGTLRNGHSNHHLLKDAYCYGTGCTEASYVMYLISGLSLRYQFGGPLSDCWRAVCG